MARVVAPILAGLTVALASGAARGQDVPDSSAADETHPVYSADERWAGPALIGVGVLFAAAAGVGGFVWLRMRDVVPPAASHEEDPAADRHR